VYAGSPFAELEASATTPKAAAVAASATIAITLRTAWV
jgi:hypothetical protein